MNNWIIDTGNTKRGVFYTRTADLISNAKIKKEGDILTPTLGEKVMRTHSQIDPRNIKLFHEDNKFHVGFANEFKEWKRELDLDNIKKYLDSDDEVLSPFVSLSYIFASKEESVNNVDALMAAQYITKKEVDGLSTVVDIVTGKSLWAHPKEKDVLNYLIFGKIKGLPNTYYILLNGFRVELFEDLPTTKEHNFEYIDLGTGELPKFWFNPKWTGAGLLDNDTVLTPKQEFSVDLNHAGSRFAMLGYNKDDVKVNLRSNIPYTVPSTGVYKFDMGDKETGYISLHLPSNNILDLDPEMAIRRTFTVHKG